MTNAKESTAGSRAPRWRGSPFTIVTRRIVTLRLIGIAGAEERAGIDRKEIVTRGYLHLRYRCSPSDGLSTTRRYCSPHGAERPRGHPLPVFVGPSTNSVPAEKLSLSSLTRRILCPPPRFSPSPRGSPAIRSAPRSELLMLRQRTVSDWQLRNDHVGPDGFAASAVRYMCS